MSISKRYDKYRYVDKWNPIAAFFLALPTWGRVVFVIVALLLLHYLLPGNFYFKYTPNPSAVQT